MKFYVINLDSAFIKRNLEKMLCLKSNETHKYCCICSLSSNLTRISEEALIAACIKKESIYQMESELLKSLNKKWN